jgi:hypothetical protein
MNDKLQEIKTDLAVNGKQTKEKRLVMAEFAKISSTSVSIGFSLTTGSTCFSLCAKASLALRIFSRSILSCSCF